MPAAFIWKIENIVQRRLHGYWDDWIKKLYHPILCGVLLKVYMFLLTGFPSRIPYIRGHIMTVLEQLLKVLPIPMSKILVGGLLGPQMKALDIDFQLASVAATNVAQIYLGSPSDYVDIDEEQLAEGLGVLIPALLNTYNLKTITVGELVPLVEQVAIRFNERIPVEQ